MNNKGQISTAQGCTLIQAIQKENGVSWDRDNI